MREWLAAALGSLFLAGSTSGAALPRNDSMMGKERPTTSALQKDRPASSSRQIDAVDVACINTAVATRESTLATALGTHQQTMTAAYAARAAALTAAYTGTDQKTIKANVKKAWDDFATTQKNAKMTSQRSRENTWKTFKTSVKACKGGDSVSDARNASMEQ